MAEDSYEPVGSHVNVDTVRTHLAELSKHFKGDWQLAALATHLDWLIDLPQTEIPTTGEDADAPQADETEVTEYEDSIPVIPHGLVLKYTKVGTGLSPRVEMLFRQLNSHLQTNRPARQVLIVWEAVAGGTHFHLRHEIAHMLASQTGSSRDQLRRLIRELNKRPAG